MYLFRILVTACISMLLFAGVSNAATPPVTSSGTKTQNYVEQPTRGLPATPKDIADSKNKRKFVEDNYVNLLRTFPDTVDMKSTERTFIRVRKGLHQEARISNSKYDLVLQLGVTSLVPADKRDTIIFKLVLPSGEEIGASQIGLDAESLWVQQYFANPLQKLFNITVNVCFGVDENVDPANCILRIYDGKEYIDLKLNGQWIDGKMNIKI